MSDLRAACIHGRYERHLWDIATGSQTCPGGRDITIDYEARIVIPPGATFIAKGVHFYGLTLDAVGSDQDANIVEGCYFYPVDATESGI